MRGREKHKQGERKKPEKIERGLETETKRQEPTESGSGRGRDRKRPGLVDG